MTENTATQTVPIAAELLLDEMQRKARREISSAAEALTGKLNEMKSMVERTERAVQEGMV